MGRGKELKYYNGALKGDYLTDKDCSILDNIIELGNSDDEDGGCIEDLKHIIHVLSEDDIDRVIETKSSEFVDKPIGTLRNYQTLGVGFMYFAKRVVLGDSVGLGKTVQISGLCNLLKTENSKQGVEFRFLYLTLVNLLDQAQRELVKFTGDYVDLVRGEKKYVERFAKENQDELMYSVVGPHSLLSSVHFQEYLREYKALYGCNPFDLIIIDEAGSFLCNTEKKTYQNAKYMADDFDWIVIANATPFETNLRNFYAQLNFCDESLLPVKTTFSKLYEEKDYSRFSYGRFNGKYKNAHIFRNQVKYRYYATTRKKIGAVMKDCTADVSIVELSPLQKDLLKKTEMPQMVYDCPSYFVGEHENLEETTPKLAELVRIIEEEDKFKDAQSILVYGIYKQSLLEIKKMLDMRGISCEVMNGDTKWEDRNDITNRFKLRDFRVLITNVQKGLNFGHCNACIFYSYDGSPSRMVQFEGRMTRGVDIIDKHIRVITSKGKELKRFKSVVAERAMASNDFAGSDFSCVMQLLLDSDKISNL